MRPGTSAGVLEVEANHLVLILSKQKLNDVDGVIHPDWVVGVHH